MEDRAATKVFVLVRKPSQLGSCSIKCLLRAGWGRRGRRRVIFLRPSVSDLCQSNKIGSSTDMLHLSRPSKCLGLGGSFVFFFLDAYQKKEQKATYKMSA